MAYDYVWRYINRFQAGLDIVPGEDGLQVNTYTAGILSAVGKPHPFPQQ